MKLKTSKSAAKRIIKFTKQGKILRMAISAQHRTSGKSKRVKQKSGSHVEVSKANYRTIKKLIPYR